MGSLEILSWRHILLASFVALESRGGMQARGRREGGHHAAGREWRPRLVWWKEETEERGGKEQGGR